MTLEHWSILCSNIAAVFIFFSIIGFVSATAWRLYENKKTIERLETENGKLKGDEYEAK